MEVEKTQKITFKERTEIDGVPIDSASVLKVRIPLNMSFTISLGKQDFYEGVIVELKSGDTAGYGEGETIAQITGEDHNTLFFTSMGIISSLDGRKFDSLEGVSEFVDSYCYGNSAAKSAVEISVYDLISRSMGVAARRILGGGTSPRITSMTIPIGSVKENLDLLSRYQEGGAKIIKVKVGKDIDHDIERINRIAENLNSGVLFFADANQGYNLGRAIRIANILARNEAIFFEQPMPRNDFFGLKDLRKKSGLPVMLDESISSGSDVVNVLRIGAADMINVKLSKSGGIRNAIKVLTVAQAGGLEAMVGCMLESRLGIAASLAVANSLSNVKYTDLDGFTYLKEQPFDGGVDLRDGFNHLIEGYGFAAKLAISLLKA